MERKIICLICILALSTMHVLLIAQNVGIGTSNPLEKLHVDGNILMDTAKVNAILFTPNAGTGKLLTSDDAGNANWEELVLPPPPNNYNGNIGYGVWGDCATNGNISNYYPVSDSTALIGDAGGRSVSISGNYAIVGSPYDDELYSNQGSVSIFFYNGSNWEFIQKLTDADGAAEDLFGSSVSISENYMVVGAFSDDVDFANQGSVCIYSFNGNSWDFMVKIYDTTGDANDYFGFSVSISGNNFVVGSPNDDDVANFQGSASIYQINGGNVDFIQKVTDDTGNFLDGFGVSVSISGDNIIVGESGDDLNSQGQGSATIFHYDGTSWIMVEKLIDTTGDVNDGFGGSVSISGNHAIAGAGNDDAGTNMDQGSATLFRYNGSNWIKVQKIINPVGASNDHFGYCVFISGEYAMIGAYADDISSNNDQGSVLLFRRVGPGWQKLQEITDPGGNALDFFGLSFGFNGSTKTFVIGSPGYFSSSGKAVFGKIN